MNNHLNPRHRLAALRVGCAALVSAAGACAKEPTAPFVPSATSQATGAPATSSGPATRPAVWERPRFSDGRAERLEMVARQVAGSPDGRQPVRDPRVLEAMRQVPRHRFVPARQRAEAHNDHPLPIGEGQTISQPYIVALMTEALRVSPGEKVLEIGTGSGYQAAVLAELTPNVFTIEIVKPLAERAAETLRTLGYRTVQCRCGDGYLGWPEAAPFDAIIVTCAAGHVPPALWQQLKPGGRLVIPEGEPGLVQQLSVFTKLPDGGRRTEVLTPCAFVPMTGRIQGR